MRIYPGLIILLLTAVVARGQQALAGHILDRVTCAKDPTQTYALYVPSAYTPQQAWPVIFCFDPGARGREPVARFQAAAEKYGYVVAGSLTSRNGPWADNAAAIQAMVNDVNAHLNLDGKRLYTAGLSGGARVATQLALVGLAKGVIACSAGFPQSNDGIPARVPFVFFGTTGTEDFNHHEMVQLDDELNERGATHRIVVFDGGHEWASVERLTEAVEWLELQAMRSGTRPKDEAMIKAFLTARLAAIPSAPPGEVWRANQEVAADFAGLADVAAFDGRAKELGATKEVKAWRKAAHDLENREEGLSSALMEASNTSVAAMRKKVAALRAIADATENSPDRQMARRVLAGAAMNAREGVRPLLEAGDGNTAARLLEMAVAIHPERSRNYFDLARARALDGDKKRALEALQQAADTGFSETARAESEPAFAKIKGEPAFQAALEKIRANPPEPPGRGREP